MDYLSPMLGCLAYRQPTRTSRAAKGDVVVTDAVASRVVARVVLLDSEGPTEDAALRVARFPLDVPSTTQ
jgi:hypothetical protein